MNEEDVEEVQRGKQSQRGRKTMPRDPSALDRATLEEVESLALFADENPNPILRVTGEGQITYANEQSDLLLQYWQVDIGGQVPEHLRQPILQAYQGGEESLHEEACEGTIFEISLVPIEQDASVHLYCVDITERRRAEARVRDLAKFPDENPNPVLRVDPAGVILYANDQSRELLASWKTRVGGALPEHLSLLAGEAMSQDRATQIDEVCEGTTYSFEFFPVPEADYLNLYARNITERRLAEARIRHARDEAIGARDKLRDAMSSLERRNLELAATMRRLDEDANQHESAMAALVDLNRHHLRPLLEHLNQIARTDEPTALALGSLDRMVLRLDRLAEASKSHAQVANKKVLLAENNAKRRSLARIALRGLGLELDIAETFAQGQQLLERTHYDVLCCSEEMLPLCEAADAQNAADRYVLLTARSIAEALPVLVQHSNLTSLVASYDSNRNTTLRNIATTVRKLATNDFFGIHKYLGWGAEVSELRVNHSAGRNEAIDRMSESLEAAGIRPSLRNRTAMIAEELLMNAIYDAPHDAGRPRNNHLERTTSVSLAQDEECVLRWGFDGSLLALSVEDPFGALTRDVVLRYLEGCYAGRAGTLNVDLASKGGAGMGLFQIMRASDLMVINSHRNSRTEVIAILDLERVGRQANGSLHFFFDS